MTDPFRFHNNVELQLSSEETKVLAALANTFIARLSPADTQKLVDKYANGKTGVDRDTLVQFANTQGTDFDFKNIITGFLLRATSPDNHRELHLSLTLLSTRAGSLLLTGKFMPFYEIPLPEREAIVNGWRTSSIPKLRLLYRGMSSASLYPMYGNRDNAILQRAMAYNPVCPVRSPPDYQPVKEWVRVPMLTKEQLLQGHWDAIVIGSGGGGGVAASELSKAGKSVLVIEKGTYYHESDLGINDNDAFKNMYEQGGFFSSVEGTINILAGSTFGGGTAINWCCSLKPQHFVREEWARQGLTHFMSPKFANDLERVCDRIGASTAGVVHNASNQNLLDGSKKLGLHYDVLPQNTSGEIHNCDFCYAGCRDGIKNGSQTTWLRDAQAHGAQFVDRAKVIRVLTKNGKATGVELLLNHGGPPQKIQVKADLVVCSAGSLQTPGVLQRSGLKNKHIGKHLRLHPCSIVLGYFDRIIDNHQGAIMTAISCSAENVDGEGYGAKLEVPCTPAAAYSAIFPWRGAADHKDLMVRYRHYSPILVLSRDKDTNSTVRYDEHGNVSVDYPISKHDIRSVLAGILQATDVLVAAGAREVRTGQFAIDPFVFQPEEEIRVDNPRYRAWRQSVEKNGLPTFGAGIFAAHQMGSSRMGVSPAVSAVQPTGETWEVKNLFVADASIFPTSTGVNPMVTTEAVALHVADAIIEKQKNAKL
ncbi:long-chain fatty alcohol dehydrogenase [Hesseltinella vesiculosa]|uniref:Long-chain-alcohol oxidase n=1 Tax=Hesseltinella vesiculosa TaxID=101127 RepID=A0A1X2GKA7_9FUNG|nr:long-chain fatty alcohol dehydrogenase [Hesseltinella vesiculosa]